MMEAREPSTCSFGGRAVPSEKTSTIKAAPEPSPSPAGPPRPTEDLTARRSIIASFLYAGNGVLRTLSTQRNMKIHWVSGLAVMLVGMALELNLATRASVIFCVFVVLCMEVLNTALESFVDLHVRQYARHAMIAKDAAAAAVLIQATGAVVVFADVLFHSWGVVHRSGPAIVRTIVFGVPLLAAMSGILWVRRSALTALLGLVAVTLLSVLAWYSRDEVFSACALTFILTGLLAKVREPVLVR